MHSRWPEVVGRPDVVSGIVVGGFCARSELPVSAAFSTHVRSSLVL